MLVHVYLQNNTASYGWILMIFPGNVNNGTRNRWWVVVVLVIQITVWSREFFTGFFCVFVVCLQTILIF